MSREDFCFCAVQSPIPGLACVAAVAGLASTPAASFVLLGTADGSFLGSVAGVGSIKDGENYTCLLCDSDTPRRYGTMQAASSPCIFARAS